MVDTSEDRNKIKVYMLISVYLEKFPEATTTALLGRDPHSINHLVSRMVYYVSFDYAEYGYDNVIDYIRAYREGKCELGENTYVIDVTSIDMYCMKCGMKYDDQLNFNPNLLSFVNPGEIMDIRYPGIYLKED